MILKSRVSLRQLHFILGGLFSDSDNVPSRSKWSLGGIFSRLKCSNKRNELENNIDIKELFSAGNRIS